MHTTTNPTAYAFTFQGKGAFTPDGPLDLTPEQVAAHNANLDAATLDQMSETGRAVLYLTQETGATARAPFVGTWTGATTWPARNIRTSFHNMAGRNGRTDFDFYPKPGERWHAVNIGDSQIARARRCKS